MIGNAPGRPGRGLARRVGSPLSGFETLVDFRRGVYRRAGVSYTSVDLMPGYSVSSAPTITPGVGYSASASRTMGITLSNLQASAFIFVMVGRYPDAHNGAGAECMGEVGTFDSGNRLTVFRHSPASGTMDQYHIGGGQGGLQTTTGVTGVGAGSRVISIFRHIGTALDLFISVNGGVATKLSTTRNKNITNTMWIGGSKTPAEAMRGIVEAQAVQLGTFTDAEVQAIIGRILSA